MSKFQPHTRVVCKVRGQSDLRQKYSVLCTMTYVLSNDYQLKISMQKSISFWSCFQKIQRILFCMNLIYEALFPVSTTSGDVKLLKGKFNLSLFFKVNTFILHTFHAINPFIKRMSTPIFVKFLYDVFYVISYIIYVQKPLSTQFRL